MQCKPLSTNSALGLGNVKTTRNFDQSDQSQDLLVTNWLLASSSGLNTRTLTPNLSLLQLPYKHVQDPSEWGWSPLLQHSDTGMPEFMPFRFDFCIAYWHMQFPFVTISPIYKQHPHLCTVRFLIQQKARLHARKFKLASELTAIGQESEEVSVIASKFYRVLTMVCNTELVGFRTLSIVRIRNNENTTFRKLGMFPFSGEGRHLLCWVP
jgi:hypothetical protein